MAPFTFCCFCIGKAKSENSQHENQFVQALSEFPFCLPFKKNVQYDGNYASGLLWAFFLGK